MSQRSATFVGLIAIVLWSSLATLTAASGVVPPFQLAAMTFGISGLCGMLIFLIQPFRLQALRQPPIVWFHGIVGLFGYHYFYFTAMRTAPAAEASLIAYLWPLLIVLLSTTLPDQKLRFHHLAGALLGFIGVVMIVTDGGKVTFQAQYAFGYAMAAISALIWSIYSVSARMLNKVPTDIVIVFCLTTSILSLIFHVLTETSSWPASVIQWVAIVSLGFGPLGLAFLVWDYGVKNGDILVLGAASYAAPLLSTVFLVLLGFSPPTWVVGLACICITVGATIAAKEFIFRSKANSKK